MSQLENLSQQAQEIADKALDLSYQITAVEMQQMEQNSNEPLVFAVSIFVLSCFIGYFVIWKVTPSLHTPLMALTNAISSIIIVGAILAVGTNYQGEISLIGFFAVLLASINIFGGFVVTQRMLAMFKGKK